jgi:hypothetical protein
MPQSLSLTIQEEIELTLSSNDSVSSAFRNFFYHQSEARDGFYLFKIKFVAFSMNGKTSTKSSYLISKDGIRLSWIIFCPKEAQEVKEDGKSESTN